MQISTATGLFLCILCGCGGSSTSEGSENATTIIENNGKDSAFFDYSDTSSYTCVPLETKGGGLIGGYDKVLVNDSLICVVDRERSNSIIIFDRQGKFRAKISAQGRGPGEYTKIGDALLCNDNIIVYDRLSRRMLFYNIDGQHIKSIHSERYRGIPFVALEEDMYAFYMAGVHDYGDNAEVILTNAKGDLLHKKYIPRKTITDARGRFGLPNYFGQNSTGVYFIPVFEDVMYQLNEKGIEPVFDFGIKDYMLSFNDISDNKGPLELKEKYSYFSNFHITDSGTFVCEVWKGSDIIVSICGNIHSKKLVTWQGDTPPLGQYKDKFVTAVPPSFVAKYRPEVANNDDNNYVVIFYDFDRYVK